MTAVSYVITVYNKSLFLPIVIGGLRGQEGTFERQYIFVDDGSTDNSLALLEKLTDDLPNVVIVEQQNQGPAIATNAGLERVTGDFIKFVDGDDVLLPWATQALLDAIRQTGCHAAYAPSVLAGTYDHTVTEHKLAIGQRKREKPERPRRIVNTVKLFLEGSQTNLTGILVKAESVTRVGGCDPRIFVQDYFLNLQLARLGDFAEIPETLFLMPESRHGRLSTQTAQEWHDTNLALARFVETEPQLADGIKQRVFANAAKRAMWWSSRTKGRSRYFTKEYWIYRWARLGLLRATTQRIYATCSVFRDSQGLRRPELDAANARAN